MSANPSSSLCQPTQPLPYVSLPSLFLLPASFPAHPTFYFYQLPCPFSSASLPILFLMLAHPALPSACQLTKPLFCWLTRPFCSASSPSRLVLLAHTAFYFCQRMHLYVSSPIVFLIFASSPNLFLMPAHITFPSAISSIPFFASSTNLFLLPVHLPFPSASSPSFFLLPASLTFFFCQLP
jgi:hypothetical protein